MKLIKNSIYIFKTDWIRILKNPLTLIVITGLMIIPSLYAWFNIEALWDPYTNASNLPIGVYSSDVGYDIEGENINVGEGVIEALKEDNQLDWQFIDSKVELDKSVQDGTLYASIYINNDFTQDLLSVFTEEYTKPKIEYTVNEKINAIAPKMTEAGAEGVTAEIESGFNEIVSGVVLQIANDMGIKLSDKLPLFYNVFDEIHTVNIKSEQFNNFLNTLNAINNDIPNMQSYMKNLNIDEVITKLDEIVIEIHNLNILLSNFENTNSLENINTSINELTTYLKENKEKLNNTLQTLEGIDFDKYINVLNNIEKSEGSLINTLNDLGVTVEDVEQLVDDIYLILTGSLDLIDDLILQIRYIASNLSTFLNNTTLTPTDVAIIVNALNDLNNTLTSLLNIINSLQTILTILNSSGSFNTIISALNDLSGEISVLQSKITYITNNIYSLDMTNIISNLDDIVVACNHILLTINNINLGDLRGEIKDVLESFKVKIESGKSYLSNLDLTNIQKLINEINTISNTIKNLSNQISIFYTNNQKKIERMESFFTNNVNQFNDVINDADIFLQTNWATIRENILNGNNLILTNLPKFEQTLNDIGKFSNTIWPKFYTFIKNLDDEATTLKEGGNLENMVDYLINDVSKGADFMASPVDLETNRLYPIDNYGSASAPFYTTLCLWVGAVLLTSVLSTRFTKENKEIKLTDKEVYLGRFFTFLSIGIIQALIVAIGDIYLLKMTVINPKLFIIFTVIISLCFTAIIYTLANLFGNVGKALAVVGLVLSISGGGGNFPIEVSGPFFRVINPLLPFTHGVNLLREPIGGIYTPTVYKSLIVLISYTTITLFIGLFGANFINPIMQKLEEKSHESHIFH